MPNSEAARRLDIDRLIISSAIFEISRTLRKAYFADCDLIDATCAIVIRRAIVVAQGNGRRVTKSDLARILGTPRQTLHRKIEHLKQLGFIKQNGRWLEIEPVAMHAPKAIEAHLRVVNLFREAAKKLDQNGRNTKTWY